MLERTFKSSKMFALPLLSLCQSTSTKIEKYIFKKTFMLILKERIETEKKTLFDHLNKKL